MADIRRGIGVEPTQAAGLGVGAGLLIGLLVGSVIGAAVVSYAWKDETDESRRRTMRRRRAAGYAY